MSDMMTFPDTWEEYEKSYGFTDNEEIYTNGARLIPSFRVKQWLNHLPSVQSELAKYSPKLDNENGELISRQAVIDFCVSWRRCFTKDDGAEIRAEYTRIIKGVKQLPSADRPQGKWKRRLVDNGFNADWVCSECGYRVKTDFVSFNFCPNCGADMRGREHG